mmetsp:Transcript_4834/g.10029  ORF Transcript_4834/g.10029 Transcript_4834/m.10029 type:complete len:177 (+) Transcript_4834:286-816(+)|eukprot:CAMPEP_0197277916 /NCGR_PEP_ID=MMETSP1432-20130617/17775_1 /TAXON_ID=44447 /ORGANISM="Pseudo-nitzschia delicatissima, Strain UNC1205" /LENGTH=176 /DNA_ID=CAMNT_0042744199 /DNA_START=264 /DNA_END=794 /DNA_ORIENTATION=+
MIGTTIGVRKALTITVFALFFAVDGIYSFQSIRPKLSCPQTFQASALFGEKSSSSENSSRKDQQEVEEFLFGSGDGADCVHNIPSDNQISSSLNRKIKELELGIGKRYIIRTQRGFLNVHHEPIDPYMSENVVNQLSDGQIVTATGPKRGIWIPHDGGGWSVFKYGGFTWLEAIDE